MPDALAGALTLADALERAGQCHPDVRAARAALDGAAADVTTAGQRPNPQLTLGAGSLSRDLGSGSLWNKTFDHSLRIDQTLERGGKADLRRQAAQALREAALADLADAQRRARFAAAQAWQDLAAAVARRAETGASAAIADEALRAQALRVKAGDAAPIDETRVAIDALRVQADLRQSEADLQAARIQLATLLAAGAASARITPAGADAAPPPATVTATATDTEAAVERRPDVQAAQRRLAAAEAARDLARSLRVRDVGVGVQVDRYPTSATNGSGSGNTLSLSVSVPLFVNHAYEGEAARAEADVASAREALARAQATARGEIAQALVHREGAADRARLAAEQTLPAAERVAAGVELAYRRGAIPLLDLLDSRRTLRAARIDAIAARADRAKADAEWRAATATP